MRCSQQTETFDQVIQIAARYFGFEPQVVFLSDKPEKGCIYLGEQRVFDHIFPLKTAKRVNHMPDLHIVLRRNMTSIDIVNNEKDLRDEARKEVKQAEDEAEAEIKKEHEEEQRRKEQAKHEKVM